MARILRGNPFDLGYARSFLDYFSELKDYYVQNSRSKITTLLVIVIFNIDNRISR